MARRTWTKEFIEEAVRTSISYAEVLRKLNIKPVGGNYGTLQRYIDKHNLDISHMLGQAHNQGKELKTFEGLSKSGAIKKRLIKETEHRCQECQNTTWNGKLITLELEHVDGNNLNNERSNLKLLCPNCHSQTSTWRNRKRDGRAGGTRTHSVSL